MSEMDAQACPYDPLCLGLCEWTDCPGQLTATPHPNNPPNSAPPSPAPTIAQAAGSHTLDSNEVATGLPPSCERVVFWVLHHRKLYKMQCFTLLERYSVYVVEWKCDLCVSRKSNDFSNQIDTSTQKTVSKTNNGRNYMFPTR